MTLSHAEKNTIDMLASRGEGSELSLLEAELANDWNIQDSISQTYIML